MKKKYITPYMGAYHISSTALLAGSERIKKQWTPNDDEKQGVTPTEIIEEKPGDLPDEITGAKQHSWSSWD